MIVDVPPGISLIFPQTAAPYPQLLQLIVLRLGPASEASSSRTGTSGKGIGIEYAGKQLTTVPSSGGPTTPLTRSQVTQRFGPSFTRRTDTPSGGPSSSRMSPVNGRESEIKYPGLIFSMDPTEGDLVEGITLVPHGTEDTPDVQRFMTRLREEGRGTWGRWNNVGGELDGKIMSCEINVRPLIISQFAHSAELRGPQPSKGITLHIFNGSGITPYVTTIGETTSQDLLADLGAPARRYWKEDGRSSGGELGSAVNDETGGKGCKLSSHALHAYSVADEANVGKAGGITLSWGLIFWLMSSPRAPSER